MRSFSLLLLLLSGLAQAQDRHMVIMGGGGEPDSLETTIFDGEMRTLGNFLRSNESWSPQISFNGGHDRTEEIIRNGVGRRGVQNTQFTQEQFDRMITQYENKIRNGEINSGDQLLVYISTHGAMRIETPNKDGNVEVSHSISATGASASDLNTLRDAKLVSLDRIQNLITLANSRGVKLGILDFSCHSGNALALQNPQTCIISASGPMHFGYNTWGDRFAGNMRRGRSLEDVYLRTFVRRDETAFPMISTEAGNSIQEEIYELITPYLYSYNSDSNKDKLAKLLDKQVTQNQCVEADENFRRLISLTQDMERTLEEERRDAPSFDRLRDAVTEYHNLQNQIRNDLLNYNLPSLEASKNNFCQRPLFNNHPQNVCLEWSDKEVLMTDIDAEITRMQNALAGATAGWPQIWHQAYIQNLQLAKTRKAQLLLNEDNRNYANYFKNFPNLQNRTWNQAMNVSREIQKIYPELYRERSRNFTGPNPCRDFVL